MTAPSLFENLQRSPARFDLSTALRIAEAEARARDLPMVIDAQPGAHLALAPVETVNADDRMIRVTANAMALVGPMSPLPIQYTELAARDRRRRAGGLSAFLDLFSDRLTWLFIEASEKYSLPKLLRWYRPNANGILRALNALIGFATPGLEDRTPLKGNTTLQYAGLLSQRTRSAVGLRALAQAELGLPVQVQQFHLRWRKLPQSEQSQMDGTVRLGANALAGAHVPDRSGQCRIIVGPVRYPDFMSLEKGQPRIERLHRLVRLYLGPVLDYDIQIILDRRDLPETQLGGGAPSARMGWNSWARNEPAIRDSDEAVITSGESHNAVDA
ncbi:MAG: type VI secretion system baseplate subunit TssG [Pseudorhodobacter sp.]